MKMINIPVF
uniref:Uncharacterized protein n=1 Tax=Romanomermis culicivorax TaxID=13658 RepID=A0A915JIU1_ROMCU